MTFLHLIFVIHHKRKLIVWVLLKHYNTNLKTLRKGLELHQLKLYGIEFFNFKRAESYALSVGKKKEQAFDTICSKAVSEILATKSFSPQYDAILVDEYSETQYQNKIT